MIGLVFPPGRAGSSSEGPFSTVQWTKTVFLLDLDLPAFLAVPTEINKSQDSEFALVECFFFQIYRPPKVNALLVQ